MVDSIENIEDALSIPIPSSEHLVLDDTRRLTGPGLLWEYPGAVLDVFSDGIAPDALIQVVAETC